jgi:CheY-like chemotaxis protein
MIGMNDSVTARPQTVYSLKNFSILLVEDYDFMQSLIGGMLKAFGVGNIMICSNAKEAINLLNSMQAQIKVGNAKPVDMILTDWMMPGGSGLDLIKWLRNHRQDMYRFMPVMLISAFASEDVVQTSRDSGANEALVKPLSAEKLASRILAMIDNPRPFIKAPGFFGPDRRRQNKPYGAEERRLKTADEIVVNHEKINA